MSKTPATLTKAPADKQASDFYSVGDILCNTWGWEQTNVDWWQVVAVGAKTIKIQRIRGKTTETYPMQGDSVPLRNEFVTGAKLKRVGEDGTVTSRFGVFRKWDGKAVAWSAYA